MNRAAPLILAVATAILFAWIFRYDVSGAEQDGHYLGSEGGITGRIKSRPIMLDRWTGKTYAYFQGYKPITDTPAMIDGWREIGVPFDANGPIAEWQKLSLPNAPFVKQSP